MPEGGFRPERAPEAKIEKKEVKRPVGVEAARAVIAWTEGILKSEKLRDLQLPLPEKRAAAIIPSLLFTTAFGCSDFQKIECGEDDAEYIATALDWITEHPDELQGTMDQLWPDQSIDAQELVNVLHDTSIYCGIPKSEGDDMVGGERMDFSHKVVVNVESEPYQQMLTAFQDNKWATEDYDFEDLLVPSPLDQDVDALMAYSRYYSAVSLSTEILAHEAAHIATGKGHAGSVKKELRQLPVAPDPGVRPLDEIYAWGGSAYKFLGDESTLASDAANEAFTEQRSQPAGE